jgi:hypothetical protein
VLLERTMAAQGFRFVGKSYWSSHFFSPFVTLFCEDMLAFNRHCIAMKGKGRVRTLEPTAQSGTRNHIATLVRTSNNPTGYNNTGCTQRCFDFSK